jgi:hypothetical protein
MSKEIKWWLNSRWRPLNLNNFIQTKLKNIEVLMTFAIMVLKLTGSPC